MYSIDQPLTLGRPLRRPGLQQTTGEPYRFRPQITTSNGTLNGQPTLDITASLMSSNQGLYQEQLILNANTGPLLEMIGGNQGQAPSVTVYYTVTRTTVADVENGSAG